MENDDGLDAHIGRRLRELRTAAGVSRERLALALNLSYQQVQKYENGLNRLSLSKAQRAADILGFRVEELVEGYVGKT